MVVVANFAPGPFPAFLREHVLLLIHEVHKQQSNTAWGRWGGCHGCINNAPKWGLVCKILHTKPILGVFENRLVCKIYTLFRGGLVTGHTNARTHKYVPNPIYSSRI